MDEYGKQFTRIICYGLDDLYVKDLVRSMGFFHDYKDQRKILLHNIRVTIPFLLTFQITSLYTRGHFGPIAPD